MNHKEREEFIFQCIISLEKNNKLPLNCTPKYFKRFPELWGTSDAAIAYAVFSLFRKQRIGLTKYKISKFGAYLVHWTIERVEPKNKWKLK